MRYVLGIGVCVCPLQKKTLIKYVQINIGIKHENKNKIKEKFVKS